MSSKPATQSRTPPASKRGSPTSAKSPAAKSATPRTRSTRGRPGFAGSTPSTGSASGRKGKFNASGEHVEHDGQRVWCASGAEAERFRQLLAMLEAGTIANLKTQPSYDLTVNNQRICRYRADFIYDVCGERGEIERSVIEDVKGMQTDEFILKAKLFNALVTPQLTIIPVKGKARHPVRPTFDDEGKETRTGAGWMHLHWSGRIPD